MSVDWGGAPPSLQIDQDGNGTVDALVDEATGYQAERGPDDLSWFLEAYIARELLPWTKRFPDEFFKCIYTLHGWDYKEGGHEHPVLVGKLINELVYEPLPPGVLVELRKKNPPNEKGNRKYRHHQLLTADTRQPHLDKQIVPLTTLMRAARGDKGQSKELFRNAFPKKTAQLQLASIDQTGQG